MQLNEFQKGLDIIEAEMGFSTFSIATLPETLSRVYRLGSYRGARFCEVSPTPQSTIKYQLSTRRPTPKRNFAANSKYTKYMFPDLHSV